MKKRMVIIHMLGAVAVVAQPQHDQQFTFPEKILDFSLSQSTASDQQHVDGGDTPHYVNSQAVCAAGKDNLSIHRSSFETANAAEKMPKKMADNTRARKGGYADFKQDEAFLKRAGLEPTQWHLSAKNANKMIWRLLDNYTAEYSATFISQNFNLSIQSLFCSYLRMKLRHKNYGILLA